jgi:lipopolysaccharide biosynthesis glycosyltransferase
MNILYTFSKDWLPLWGASCLSLFTNNLKPINVYIATDNLTEKEKEIFIKINNKFNNIHNFIFLNIDDSVFNSLNLSYTKYALYRLLSPLYILEDKILYLDTDTIISNNIEELYNTDILNFLVGGVPDTGIKEEIKESIESGKKDKYINSGVLLINLKKWKEENLTSILIEEINKKEYPYPDQTVLNMICKNKILLLNNIYNYSYCTKGISKKLELIKIIHFAGQAKNKNFPLQFIWDHGNKSLTK